MEIDVTALVVGYGTQAVAFVDGLTLRPDRVTLVAGPNACGKTTLLKTLGGLLEPLGGKVMPSLTPGPGGAVFVHSSGFLFAGSVRKNLLLASRGAEKSARAALGALGVERLWAAPVAALSTGQRQRVALARALAAEPALLLVDEPEGGLDAEALALWAALMARAVHSGRPTIVVASHRAAALGEVPLATLLLRPATDGRPASFVGELAAASLSAGSPA